MSEQDTLTTQCFFNIREMILSGQLLPGEKLKGDYLRQKLKTGLSPIREALSRLVTTRLVKFEEKKGFTIVIFSENEVRDIVETYGKIECMALKNAMENGDDKWEGRIISALYGLSKVETKNKVAYEEWAPKNTDFHNSLVSACDSSCLLYMHSDLQQMSEWFTRLSYKFADSKSIRTNHREHKIIAEAVIARKLRTASNYLYEHITGGLTNLVIQLKKNDLIRG